MVLVFCVVPHACRLSSTGEGEEKTKKKKKKKSQLNMGGR